MKRQSRIVPVALVIVMAGCSAAALLGYKVKPDYPRVKDSSVTVSGLEQPVEAWLDEAGIPHIHARNETDLMRAVGYFQGRDRFFEMDLMRRMARGRLSELVGEQPMKEKTTVDLDRTMRGWGFEKMCEADQNTMDPELAALLQAYAEGVNVALAEHRPLEYRLLRVEPEPWKLSDSLAVGLITAWGLSHNWKQELFRFLLAWQGGLERAASLYPHEPWPGGVSLAQEGEVRELLPAVAPEIKGLFPKHPRPAQDSDDITASSEILRAAEWVTGASNGWAIGGSRTASGKPIVANDPHITHMLPSMFYQQHLHCPDFDVIGATVPGVPYVLAGHTAHVAWGLTSAVADAADLYIEQPVMGNPQMVAGPGGNEPLDTVKMVIRVRVRKKFEERHFSVRRTRRGPLLNDLYPGLVPEDAPLLSIRWEVPGAGHGMGGYRAANRATTVQELFAALHLVKTPLNVVLAGDTSGTIGLSTTGTVPLRKGHRGTFPVPAWVPGYDWSGCVPMAQMPQALGGADDLLVNANNVMYDMTRSPVLFQVDSAPSYRLKRAREMLAEKKIHDLNTEADAQLDVTVLRGRKLTPVVVAALDEADGNPVERAARDVLRSWDFVATPDSAAAAVFYLLYRKAVLTAFEDEMGGAGRAFVLALPYPYLAFERWFADNSHPAWDDLRTPQTETRDQVLLAAFRETVAELSKAQGEQVGDWRWGAVHYRHFRHMFGGKKALAGILNLPVTEVGGGWDSICKSQFDYANEEQPFRSIGGAALRMGTDLGDIEHGYWIIDTGGSGWPLSPHYGDQYKLWAAGQTLPMISNWDEIRERSSARIQLMPHAFAQ